METNDIAVAILKEIRDEVRATNTRLDATNTRLDDLSRRVVESEIRTATAIADLSGTVREMTGVLRSQLELRPRLERCERDIDDLKRRLG